MVKLCTDCKYHRFIMDGQDECTHKKSIFNTNLVNGYISYRTCIFMREGYSESGGSSCGPDAKLFEQKKAWWKLW
jgi:hypothetical protein